MILTFLGGWFLLLGTFGVLGTGFVLLTEPFRSESQVEGVSPSETDTEGVSGLSFDTAYIRDVFNFSGYLMGAGAGFLAWAALVDINKNNNRKENHSSDVSFSATITRKSSEVTEQEITLNAKTLTDELGKIVVEKIDTPSSSSSEDLINIQGNEEENILKPSSSLDLGDVVNSYQFEEYDD